MKNAEPRRIRLPIGTALLSVTAIAATCHGRLGMQLEDARDFLATFEWWRPITGHLAHAGAVHLILNLAVFVPLGALREGQVGTRRFLVELLALAASVAVGIRLLHGHWDTYRGLSGVVYGLLTVVLLSSTRKSAAPEDDTRVACSGIRMSFVIFLAAKSALEYGGEGWLVGRGWFESSLSVMYLPGSHCAGIAGGAAIALVAMIKSRARSRSTRRITIPQDHAEVQSVGQ